MAVKVADTLAPMADFPIAEAKDVAFTDGETLQKKLDDGSLGGGSGTTFVGTHEEWEALSSTEKGKYEFVDFTDDFDGRLIDDTASATDKVYSSSKVVSDFAPIRDSADVSTDTKVYRKDLNDVGFGYYRCTTECSNLPVSNGGYVHTIVRGDGFKFQTYMSDGGEVYTRYKKVVATWEAWKRLATEKKQVKFSGIKTKTIPINSYTKFDSVITIDKTSQYLVGYTVVSNTETSADTNIYYDIDVYDVTGSKKVPYFENSNLGWKHNPVKAVFCERNCFICELTVGHTYDVRIYTNIAMDYRGELWVKEV